MATPRQLSSQRSGARGALTIAQTPTGYWAVRRGSIQLATALTRSAAEAERELFARLARRSPRRAAGR
jgi:hypothetical protein